MSTLSEIEVAVTQLPPKQQDDLYAFLAAQIEARPKKKGLSPEEFAAWLETARGAGTSDMTTDEIMAMTRGEE